VESKGKSKQDAWEDADRHASLCQRNVIANTFENIGETIDKVYSTLKRSNPVLEGVLTNTIMMTRVLASAKTIKSFYNFYL
jgi:hypothetical protein